jgi:hypothetical protein
MSLIIKKNILHLNWENNQITTEFHHFFDKSKLHKSFEEFNPKKDVKLFITKYINLPRVKLREYVKDKNIGLTTNLENADIVITSPAAIIDAYTEQKYLHFVNVSEILQFKDLFLDATCLDDYSYNFVSIHWHTMQTLNNKLAEDLNNKSKWVQVITDLDSLEELKTKTLCYPDLLVSSIQEDGVIIDYDYYKQLDSMISSSDDDNLILAMELMSNSYYDKSAAYLLTLFYEHGNRFVNSSKKNHVNFKGLLDYFNMSTRSIHMPFNKIIEELTAKQVLTKENMDIITKLIIIPNTDTSISNNYDSTLIRPMVLVMDNPDFVKHFGSSYTINIESND